jgi:hypothetical protein
VSRWAGPIIDVLLDYVGNVQLCSRLKEHIDSFEDWAVVKEKAGMAATALRQKLSLGQVTAGSARFCCAASHTVPA